MAGEDNIMDESTDIVEKKKNGKPLLIGIVVIVVAVLISTFAYLTYESSHFVKTENATVESNMITIVSKMAGTIVDVKVKQGDYVEEGDIIMELEPVVTDSSQIDNSFIRATKDGVVLKTVGSAGQLIPSGQTVAYIEDETEGVYVLSNIDEKDINNVKIGEDVDITIDQFGSDKFTGRVVEVGSATNSAFSIVSSSSSGTFVKSTKLVPVKIEFTQPYEGIVVGANATVNIHIN